MVLVVLYCGHLLHRCLFRNFGCLFKKKEFHPRRYDSFVLLFVSSVIKDHCQRRR